MVVYQGSPGTCMLVLGCWKLSKKPPVLPSLSHGHVLKNQLVDPGSNHLQMNQSLNTKRKEKPSNQLILGQMLTNIGGPSTGKLEKWFGRCTNLGVLEVNGDSLFVEKKSL